jgi:lipoate-protein ligase A
MTDTWRFIDTGPCSAPYNMAIDEAIATVVRKNNAPPTLRLYGWDVPSVTIGYFQKISDVHTEYCVEHNIPIVRRQTGGRAILHTHELTYSFSIKTTHGLFSKGLRDSYKKISSACNNALLKVGLLPETRLRRKSYRSRSSLCFHTTSYGEITINNKKVIGSAQKRWIDGLLQQGSIPYTVDNDDTVKVFRGEDSRVTKDFIIGLKDIFPDFNPDTFNKILKTSFEETFGIWLIPSPPSPEEISLARELEFQKYLTKEWNYMR